MAVDAPGAGGRTLARVGGLDVVLVDSITLVRPEDAVRVVVSGSHGGTSAAAFAAAVPALLYAFNDAGIGKDGAGTAGLALLEARGIAACAVSHRSARIGEAADTLASGVVSAVNAGAERLGVRRGDRLLDRLASVLAEQRG